jgi:hypothetical protein
LEQVLQRRILCLTKAQITGNNEFENTFTESITRDGFWLTISFEEILKQIHGFAVSVFRPLV